MKKILSLLCGASLAVSLMFTSVTSVEAKEVKATKVGDVMNDEQVKTSQEILKNNPKILEGIKNTNKLFNNGIISSMRSGPAPAVSKYYVYFVADSKDGTNYTGEYINGMSTSYDHNGTIYVITIEVGYGREYSTFNGATVTASEVETLDFNNDRIVDGFWNVFKLTNVTNGLFESKSTSLNSPGKSISTSVYIQ